jgi:transmembrane sensor
MTRPHPHAADIEETAALWWARMASELKTPEDEAAFDAWLAESPEHGEAYNELCALDDRFSVLEGQPELAAYRVEAQLIEEKSRRSFLQRHGAGLAATITAAAASALGFVYFNTAAIERQDFSTQRGETREVTFSDGSEAILGSDTRLAITFSNDQRLVTIQRGQVFFDVARDVARPFVAVAEERTITAFGTAFDVRAFDNDLTVTLLRGRVAVAPEGRASEAMLQPGQQFRALLGVTSVRDVNAEAEVAWRGGVLDFDDVSLGEAVARFNRSGTRSIILSDTSLLELRVSGVFRVDEPMTFVTALAAAFPVQAELQSSGDIVLERRRPE